MQPHLKEVGRGIQEIYLKEMIMKLQVHHIIDEIQTSIHSQKKRDYMGTFARSAQAGASTLVKSGVMIAWRVLDNRLVQAGNNSSKDSSDLIRALQSSRCMAKLPSMMCAFDHNKASSFDNILVVKTGTIAAQVRLPSTRIFGDCTGQHC